MTIPTGYEILAPAVGVLDGTSVRSYGSRHRIVNQKTLRRRRNELNDAIIRDLRGDIQTTLPSWMGTTTSGRSAQRDCYDKADLILTQRIEENRTKRKATRRHIDKIYISLSDPEAGISRDKENVFCPMYCGQILADSKSLLILGMELSNRITDVGTIGPMLDQVESCLGIKLAQVHADATYSSLMDLHATNYDSGETLKVKFRVSMHNPSSSEYKSFWVRIQWFDGSTYTSSYTEYTVEPGGSLLPTLTTTTTGTAAA